MGLGYGIQPYGTSPYGGYGAYYTYDLANQMIKEVRCNGTVSYYTFDAAARSSFIRHQKSDASLIESYTYTRDEAGNILTQLRGSDSISTYWNYDQAGNRAYRQNVLDAATTYWEYDAADQMTRQRAGTATSVYFSFDANGNLAVEHDTDASAGRTYYDYEPRNLLSRVDFPGAIATNYFQLLAVG